MRRGQSSRRIGRKRRKDCKDKTSESRNQKDPWRGEAPRGNCDATTVAATRDNLRYKQKASFSIGPARLCSAG